MMDISEAQLRQILLRAGLRAGVFIEPLRSAMAEFEINTPARQAAFLAQIGHESSDLLHTVENLNYYAPRLVEIWPKRFPSLQFASYYAANPERLGNYVYAHRLGNGDEASGDGYKFCGRGLIQLTGKDLYRLCGSSLHLPLLDHPELIEQPVGASRSAAWYWATHGLNALADRGDFDATTRAINGKAMLGANERRVIWERAKRVLGV